MGGLRRAERSRLPLGDAHNERIPRHGEFNTTSTTPTKNTKNFLIIPEWGACAARSALAYPSETPLKTTKIIIEGWNIIKNPL